MLLEGVVNIVVVLGVAMMSLAGVLIWFLVLAAPVVAPVLYFQYKVVKDNPVIVND